MRCSTYDLILLISFKSHNPFVSFVQINKLRLKLVLSNLPKVTAPSGQSWDVNSGMTPFQNQCIGFQGHCSSDLCSCSPQRTELSKCSPAARYFSRYFKFPKDLASLGDLSLTVHMKEVRHRQLVSCLWSKRKKMGWSLCPLRSACPFYYNTVLSLLQPQTYLEKNLKYRIGLRIMWFSITVRDEKLEENGNVEQEELLIRHGGHQTEVL